MEKSKPKEILELEEVYGIKLEEQINDKIIKTNYFKLDENENIVEIILIGNKLENIKGFDKFEYLQYLSLGANKITKIENLDNLKNLTMLSCFKLYNFIFDFAVEVMRNKLLLFDFQLINSDYESFYDSKRIAYDNLNTISEASQYKLKQVMFKMFEQADFIDNIKNKNIQKPYLSEKLIKLIVQDNPKYLGAFLYSDYEINENIKRYG